MATTLKRWTAGLAFAPVFALVTATVLLILFHENCSASTFSMYFAKYFGTNSFSGLYPAFFWYGCSFLILGVIPFVLAKTFLRKEVPTIGAGLGDWRFGLPAVLALFFAFLPILVAVSYLPEFQTKYPLFSDAKHSTLHFVIHEGAYAVYFIGWEFIFRGFLLFSLKPRLGLYAIFIQTVPFAILHFGKPQIETLAAVFAGIVLGALALRARSFWYGWLLHILVAISNDVLAVIHHPMA